MTRQTSAKPIWFRAYSLRNKDTGLGALYLTGAAQNSFSLPLAYITLY
jgi:hypothetical protein